MELFIYSIKDNNDFVIKIKQICRNKGYGIRKLEEQISVSYGYLSRCKESQPTLDKILRIANSLNMDVCFCDKSDLAKITQPDSNIESENNSNNVDLEHIEGFELSSTRDLIEYLDMLEIDSTEIEKHANLAIGLISKYRNASRSPTLSTLLKLANFLEFKLYFLNPNNIKHKDSYLELSQSLIDSGVITTNTSIKSNHPIISDLNKFFTSDKVSDEQKTALESKIKNLLYEETKKLL